MNDTATPSLNKALAAFQAEGLKIVKDEVGVIPGKDGKQGYKYRYADLATVAAVALPVLAKHGLSFFAKPVIAGNQFGLACKLKHESGEEEEGFYPLPSQGTPQAIGSVITYARRYSLLMMTGLAPADDDDDAASANTTQRFAPQSAAEAFENASPVPPAQPAGKLVDEYTVLAAEFATEAAGRDLWRTVTAKAKAREITRDDARQLQDLITARITDLKSEAEGTVPLDPEDPWMAKVEDILNEDHAAAARADLERQRKTGSVSEERHGRILAAIDARAAGRGSLVPA
jgi:hypothetical protein